MSCFDDECRDTLTGFDRMLIKAINLEGLVKCKRSHKITILYTPSKEKGDGE